MIELCWLDGTWSKPRARSEVSRSLAAHLDPAKVRFTYVDYPATYGPATGAGDVSLEESVRVGVRALAGAVQRSPYRAVVGGYSQGAMVAVRFARDILPHRPDLFVDAVAALGNPHQLRHNDRSGIAGPLTVPRPLFSLYAAGDPIADLPIGSPLRSIADLTKWMSVRDPAAQRKWAEQTARDVPTKAQRWFAPLSWPGLASAGWYARNYLDGTNHTKDYNTSGHTMRLARLIEGVAA